MSSKAGVQPPTEIKMKAAQLNEKYRMELFNCGKIIGPMPVLDFLERFLPWKKGQKLVGELANCFGGLAKDLSDKARLDAVVSISSSRCTYIA